MKKICGLLALLLAFCTILISCGETVSAGTETDPKTDSTKQAEINTYEEKTFDMKAAGAYYKQLGRSCMIDTTLCCDFGTAGFEMTADCKGDIKLSVVAESVRLEIVVDGVKTEHFFVSTGEHTIASGLSAGIHTIRVINESLSKLLIQKITLSGNLMKTPETSCYLEVIGDSVTAGAGLYGKFEGSDATAAYAYVATEILGCDYTNFGIGGTSIAYAPGASINLKYPYASTSRAELSGKPYTPYRKPDLVVINLGTNDNWQWFSGKLLSDGTEGTVSNANKTDGYYTYEKFDAAFDQFIESVFEINGSRDIPILFVFGCMINQNYTMGTDRMLKRIEEKVAEGYKWKTVWLTTNRSGENGHPDRAGAKKQGEELAAFIGKEYSDIFGETMKNAVIPVRKDAESEDEKDTVAPKPERPSVTPSEGRLVLNFDTTESFEKYMENGNTGFILPHSKKTGEIRENLYYNSGNECFFEDTTRLMSGDFGKDTAYTYTIEFLINFETFSKKDNDTVFNLHSYKEDGSIADWNKMLTMDPDGTAHIDTARNPGGSFKMELGKWYVVKYVVNCTDKTVSLFINDEACGTIGSFKFNMPTPHIGFRFGNGGGCKFYVDDIVVTKVVD